MRNNISITGNSRCKLFAFLLIMAAAFHASAQIVVDNCNTGTFLQQGNGSQNVTASGAIGGSRDVSISNAGTSSYIAHFDNTGYIRVNPYYNGSNPTGNFDIGWGNSDVSGGTDLNLNVADYSRIELRLTKAPFNTGQIAVRFNKPGDPDYSSASVNILGQNPITYTFQLSDFSGLNPSDIDGISIGFSNCDPDSSSEVDYIQFSGFADADGDGIGNGSDNCPNTANANQLDSDGDGIGNVCDDCPNDADNDVDGDGVCGNLDNCPLTANADQLNTDGDSQGNACDPDDDNDGVADEVDNCPLISNSNQLDTDGDGIGNACDTDDDGDGVADASDNCPLISNSNQLDTDGDGIGNVCDPDDDNDGIADAVDNCPFVANANQADANGNGIGDACEAPDSDCDGKPNSIDKCSGGNDAVDNNNDGKPDCKYPPAYNQIIAAWKCGNNKAYVCHSGSTICVNKISIADHIAHGDYLGPCGNASCGGQARGNNGAEERQESSEMTAVQEIVLYPNPASSEAWLDLSAFEGSAFAVRLLDVRGVLVREFNVAEASAEMLRLDLSGVAAGLYFVQLQPDGEEAQTLKLVVE